MAPSTDLVPFGQFAIAEHDPRALLAAVQANLGGQKLTERDLDTIKMPTGGNLFFSVPGLEDDTAEKTVRGVIVHHKLVRAYWTTSIDDGGGSVPPDCHSPGVDSQGVMYGFGTPGDERRAAGNGCEGCPHAEFGTAKRKGKPTKGQACGAYHLLFVAGPTDLLPVIVRVSPGSLENAKKFLLRLASKMVPYYGVQVEIGLEKATEQETGIDYAKATFRVLRMLEVAEREKVKAIGDVFGPLFDRMAAAQAMARNDRPAGGDGHDVDSDALDAEPTRAGPASASPADELS